MATMAYTPAYTYDTLPRSLSRATSLSYIAPQPLMHPHSIYADPIPHPYSNAPYTTYDYSRSSTSLVPFSRPLTTYDPYYSAAVGHVSLPPRPRLYSGASYMTGFGGSNQYPLAAFHQIRFKRKGAFSAGITLAEAQAHIRLSNNDRYTTYDLNADSRGAIRLSVTWNGYPPMMYEIPLDTRADRFSLETLARRISRACVHYFQSNAIPVARDRIEIHHIEEVGYGVWQPMLRAI